MTSRILCAVLAGLLLLTAACTGDEQSPAPDATASSQAASPSADPTPTVPEATASGSAPSATSSDQEKQVLLDRVRAEGELSVIVEVSLDGTAELNTAERRQLITEAQDDLIAELDPAHVSVQTRFENTAQLTLTVDEEGLHELFASPRVTRVWENESIPLD